MVVVAICSGGGLLGLWWLVVDVVDYVCLWLLVGWLRVLWLLWVWWLVAVVVARCNGGGLLEVLVVGCGCGGLCALVAVDCRCRGWLRVLWLVVGVVVCCGCGG